MKKLNITKEGFEKSKYFTNKYGKLEYVSESGNLYKTETGNILKFKEKVNPRNSLKRKSEMKEPIDDTAEPGGEEEEQLTSDEKTPASKKGKSFKASPTCFNELKDYIEDAENRPYNREVGAAVDGDGRLGSVADEANIISWLQEIFFETDVEIKKPAARSWYDVEIVVNGKSYYTNIKTTRGGGDNISSNEGVLYYLTGKIGSFKEVLKIQEPLTLTTTTDETVDYFLLVMFKNTRQVIFTSLGRLAKLYPNSSNPPFQIPWNNKDNRGGTSVRDPIEQRKYVASVWLQSLSAGANKLDYFRNQLNNFINFSNRRRR